MSITSPKVTLIAYTPDPVNVCALAARTCYSALPLEDLLAKAKTDQADFLRGVIRSGHHSVLEHAVFTFYISDVSRALLAQITRHRIASFSVQSQRYVSMSMYSTTSCLLGFPRSAPKRKKSTEPRWSRWLAGTANGRKRLTAIPARTRTRVLYCRTPVRPA